MDKGEASQCARKPYVPGYVVEAARGGGGDKGVQDVHLEHFGWCQLHQASVAAFLLGRFVLYAGV